MSELAAMMNIGKEMEKKLISVGIESSEQLIEVGAKDAFLRLKQKYPNVCLVHLYTLEGAIHDTEYMIFLTVPFGTLSLTSGK